MEEKKDKLDITLPEETPEGLAGRLLRKTGPEVENTIRTYCGKEGLVPSDPNYVLLALAGALVSAMGRRAQRKYPETDLGEKEMIRKEWQSAFNAHNYMAEIIGRLGDIDKVFTQKAVTVKHGWKDVKPHVASQLETLSIKDLDTLDSRNKAAQLILLEQYRFLEKNTKNICFMLILACKKYGLSGESVAGLTENIVEKHYPKMPAYEPESVSRDMPLAYETRVLEFWRALVGILS